MIASYYNPDTGYWSGEEQIASWYNPIFYNRGGAPSDLNNAKSTGFYVIGSDLPTNAPSGFNWAIVAVFKVSDTWIVQVAFTHATVMIRRYIGTPVAWTSWAKFSAV